MVEFSNLKVPLWGVWQRGESKGQRARLDAYRAGSLLTEDDRAQFGSGAPEDFLLESGQTAAQFLKTQLSYPKIKALHYGAIREALVSAHIEAVYGQWFGLLNFSGGLCYVDNQEGDSAMLRFGEHDCLGIVQCKAPSRAYDLQRSVSKAPEHLRDELLELARQHESHYQVPLTGLFWSEGDVLSSSESLYALYPYGFEMLEPLLLADAPWSDQRIEDSEADPKATDLICGLAARYLEDKEPIEIDKLELAQLFPPKSKARKSAMEAVMNPKFAVLLRLAS